MKDKLKAKTLALIDLVINYKGKVLIFFLVIPILFLIVFFNLLEMNQSNLFFMIIFLLNYYIAVFILTLLFVKIITTNKTERPILRVVKRLNFTHNKALRKWEKWEGYEYKQPLRPLVVAEIGVYDGTYSKKIIQFLNIKQLVLVDPWKAWWWLEPSTKFQDDDLFYENLYKKVKNMFSNNPKVRIVRDTSLNAAKMFDDEYFDFIDINAGRTYESHKSDLEAWYPKLKKFGIICGGYLTPNSKYMMKAAIEFSFRHKALIHHGEYGEYGFYWFTKV
jgi:hypothetical protein